MPVLRKTFMQVLRAYIHSPKIKDTLKRVPFIWCGQQDLEPRANAVAFAHKVFR